MNANQVSTQLSSHSKEWFEAEAGSKVQGHLGKLSKTQSQNKTADGPRCGSTVERLPHTGKNRGSCSSTKEAGCVQCLKRFRDAGLHPCTHTHILEWIHVHAGPAHRDADSGLCLCWYPLLVPAEHLGALVEPHIQTATLLSESDCPCSRCLSPLCTGQHISARNWGWDLRLVLYVKDT